MHISGLDNFTMFQINKKGKQLINDKNITYSIMEIFGIPNPKIKFTSDNKWICQTCTYHNELQSTKCEMCLPLPPNLLNL